MCTQRLRGKEGVTSEQKPDHSAMILVSLSVEEQSDYGRSSVEAKFEGAQLESGESELGRR